MTTTRSKAVGRAGAAARKAKHDQRTPLPAKGAKPVGNPTAEALADEVKKTPRKRTAKPAAAEQPVATPGTEFVEEDLSTTVKTRRDAGETWRAISESLSLGPGKTGTSRARRLYKQANDGASAPRKEPKARTRRALADPYAGGVDSTDDAPHRSRSRAASVPMHRHENYRLEARDKRSAKERGGRPKMGDVNSGHIGPQQIRSLRRIFEGDGYTVTAYKQQADGTWVESTVAS